MAVNTFSIITPTYNTQMDRTIKSVLAQTYPDFEYIIVDDGSDWDTYRHIQSYEKVDSRVTVVRQEHRQRVIARNYGMSLAKNEWICWLDADDFYFPFYLQMLTNLITQYPEAKVINFGGVLFWNDWGVSVKWGREYQKGDVFKSGEVMSGGFIFKRECLQGGYYLPEHTTPYGFGGLALEEYPELRDFYKPGQTDLGNPWGDDFVMFYRLTRKHQPQYVKVAPYGIIIRGKPGERQWL